MIDVKLAVAEAILYFRDLMGADRVSDILLEEVSPSADERFWEVTLSALLPESKDATPERTISLAEALGSAALRLPARRRIYKVFEIDAGTGKVRSMKMRSAA